MSDGRIIALLGRRDEPTDGVADYCDWLAGSLKPLGWNMEVFQVRWAQDGWDAALSELRRKARDWKGAWVLLQYTTLAWSRRGFPWRTPEVLSTVRKQEAHCGVIFHDFGPFVANGIVGTMRRICHLRVLESLYRRSDCAIFTVPIDKASWLTSPDEKAVHIPVGANCPEPRNSPRTQSSGVLTVAVYCVTSGHRMAREVGDIGCVIKAAKSIVGKLRLVVLGRGSLEADSELRAEFAGTDVDVQTLGLLSPEEVSRVLSHSDALLFVRGHISSRRGSAIAGIACGLPVVGYEGPETGWPLTEAGLLLVPQGDRGGLTAALARVLSDAVFRLALRERSRRAQAQYFSWSSIAACLARVLSDSAGPS